MHYGVGDIQAAMAEQPVLDLALRMDSAARSAIRFVFPRGLFPVWHFYKRESKTDIDRR